MAFIRTIDDEHAEGALGELYAGARESQGYVPNLMCVFSLHPEVYEAWDRLKTTIAGSMDMRRYELVTLGAARQLRSSYCSLAHGKILAERFLDPASVREVALGHASEVLDPAEAAIVAFAEKVAGDASSVTEADVEGLRSHGLDDREILDVIVAAAARSFFSKTLDATGALADASFAELEPELRDALTVGRPIDVPPREIELRSPDAAA